MEDDANVFKLIGPVLVKQEKNESQSNVNKRVEFINSELYVCCKYVTSTHSP